jgi:hypothetical protein
MSIIKMCKDDMAHGMEYDIVSSLNNLYSTHSIYRTIIVCDDDDLDIYKCRLEDNDHNVYVLTEYEAIDYDNIDTRIFIIKESDFITFIERYNDNDGTDFYNMILFISQKNKEVLTNEYKRLINNDNIII